MCVPSLETRTWSVVGERMPSYEFDKQFITYLEFSSSLKVLQISN